MGIVIGWSLMIALFITYLNLIGSNVYKTEMVTAFSFVISIIIPMIIGAIIDFRNVEKIK